MLRVTVRASMLFIMSPPLAIDGQTPRVLHAIRGHVYIARCHPLRMRLRVRSLARPDLLQDAHVCSQSLRVPLSRAKGVPRLTKGMTPGACADSACVMRGDLLQFGRHFPPVPPPVAATSRAPGCTLIGGVVWHVLLLSQYRTRLRAWWGSPPPSRPCARSSATWRPSTGWGTQMSPLSCSAARRARARGW